jgi:PRTRC genetic system protein C
MESRVLTRFFEVNGQKLPDPNPQLTVEEVRTFYSHEFPDIATASITGPEVIGDKLLYRFSRAIGSKG